MSLKVSSVNLPHPGEGDSITRSDGGGVTVLNWASGAQPLPSLCCPPPGLHPGTQMQCEHPGRSQPSDLGMRTKKGRKAPGRPELPGSGDAEVSLGSCFDRPLPVPERV